ncbi:unnamed protein product [Fraxinus pennsylvanica]|uniref:Uncharacterized protein n=1 Tax=Fraxinus pennsylvanica TaxID=56036 RepID=A0AAD1ZBW3_9LAMI|nr:unnamed protein product [Fraxinus pennsylvanica]
MGSCLSKKSTSSSSSPGPILKPQAQMSNTPLEKKKAEEEIVMKNNFVTKHRKSHEVERPSEEEKTEVRKATEVVEMGKNLSPGNEINGELGNGKEERGWIGRRGKN